MQESQLLPRSSKTNLYDLAPGDLERMLRDLVKPAFRAKQVAEWLHDKGVASFEAMTNLPKEQREHLAAQFTIAFPDVRERTEPAADGSQKYLFTLNDGSLIEAVYMPMTERTTLCLSSQAGCAVGCTFCVTGFFGPGRNIRPSEIVGQYEVIRHEKQLSPEHTNLVFMGMGEPLLNLENVATALEIFYLQIAPRRITISTSGIIPGLRELAELDPRPNLAVSINAPDRKRREEIMPITKKYPLEELIAALHDYPLERGREITIEYVLLAGWNDFRADARMLSKLLRGLRVKVNAIPFNPDPNLPAWMKRPSDDAIDNFVDELVKHDVPVTVRRSKGEAISAACGQLRGKTERKRR